MIIEPVYRAPIGDDGDWGEGELLGYRVISKTTGAVLGFGETRSDAFAQAYQRMFALA
jgi:hypothetical protein